MLKQSGHSHVKEDVKKMKVEECAVLCHACPLPGINLPDNWKQQPESK